jgi:hypothetical protein
VYYLDSLWHDRRDKPGVMLNVDTGSFGTGCPARLFQLRGCLPERLVLARQTLFTLSLKN